MKLYIKILSLSLALLMALSLCACKNKNEDTDTPAFNGEYADEYADIYGGLFSTAKVHKIEVAISEADWADLTANPLAKTKYAVDITLDGETVENVSFATKGNTSLMQVAASDSERYSFKVNFGKYEKGQTYHGLDKLSLNNMMADATYMKDYLSYTIMRRAGMDAPLIGYAALYINGAYHGLYAAIEAVDDSFLDRNTGGHDGALYKPETSNLGNMTNIPQGGGEGMTPPNGMTPPDGMTPPNGMTPPDGTMPPEGSGFSFPGGMATPDGSAAVDGTPAPGSWEFTLPDGQGMTPPDGGSFPGGMSPGGDAGGADLVYIDDEVSSYPSIFDNEENKVTEEQEKALIAAIKTLNEGGDIEGSWDIESLICYFAAHNFVLNYDSYTGGMLHNYYLYEKDGKVTVYPWDYNLAFCGFMGGQDATAAVNTPIDSPLSGAEASARPLWNVIVSNEKYLAAYHECCDKLLKSFFENGECTAEIERVYALIKEYVETDPSAFFTADEVKTAADTLKSFCQLRADSIRRQLNGSLGSAKDTQTREDMVSADGLDISAMGSYGGGNEAGGPGGQGGFPGGQGGFPGGFPGGQGGMQPPGGAAPTQSAP